MPPVEKHAEEYKVLALFNSLSPNLKFSLELQVDDRLNYLDLTLVKNGTGFSYDIYRKPTATDAIIPRDSCHPYEHKMAAVRYFIDRINTYDLSTSSKQAEIDTVKHILRSHNRPYGILLLAT